MLKKFTLGKKERLKSRKLIEQLFSEGKVFTIAPFRVLYLMNTGTAASLQFAAGVSTKNFKKAVDRNRVKRLVKEAWRLQKSLLENKLHEQTIALSVFIIYTAKELPVYKEVADRMEKIIDRLVSL